VLYFLRFRENVNELLELNILGFLVENIAKFRIFPKKQF
jgi:hypothetical protein